MIKLKITVKAVNKLTGMSKQAKSFFQEIPQAKITINSFLIQSCLKATKIPPKTLIGRISTMIPGVMKHSNFITVDKPIYPSTALFKKLEV
ncbi:MAG: hypothetical protein A3E82_01705 [Gammaproteobacteria bacterium RIFCSPHIGHO2_12_FULL_38_11]|nr:MAG: hypothetical protein A3E82_01705 [Gammaproteobacteria bacterium RIFCSPHIGHO2_12_FULL_38_11]